MSYKRVIPRDLFNEASLLKCYGQLYLQVEGLANVKLTFPGEGTGLDFGVVQSEDDGSLTLEGVWLFVRDKRVRLHRPLNSRQPWPLYASPDEDTEYSVFNEDGSLTDEMEGFLNG